MEILGDLLREFFSDNLTLDQKIDLLRDENLGLKSQLFHALCGIYDEDLTTTTPSESSEEEDVGVRRRRRPNTTLSSGSKPVSSG